MPSRIDITAHYPHPELTKVQAEELSRLVEAAAAVIKSGCATLRFGVAGGHPDFNASNREALTVAIATMHHATAAVAHSGALDQPCARAKTKARAS